MIHCQPFFWLGIVADNDTDVIETYERLRYEEAELDRVLPHFVELQDDE